MIMWFFIRAYLCDPWFPTALFLNRTHCYVLKEI